MSRRRGEYFFRMVLSAGIAGAAVVLGVDRLGENDRALAAQLLDQQMVPGREIDIVGGIASAGGAHVGGVERVLEREHNAVHRHLLKIGISPVLRIERGGTLQCVWLLPEKLADRRRALRQRSFRGVKVVLAFAGNRTLAADVEGTDRVDLPRIRLAYDHAVLLVHGWVRGGRLHAAELERRSPVLVEVRQDRRRLYGFSRESQRRFGA